jgi:hypothetical protein
MHWLGTDLTSEHGGWRGQIGLLSVTVLGSDATDWVATVVLGSRRWTHRAPDARTALASATEQAATWAAAWQQSIDALTRHAAELRTLRRPAPKRPPYST